MLLNGHRVQPDQSVRSDWFVTEEGAVTAVRDEPDHHQHEHIRWDTESGPRFTNSPEIDDREHGDRDETQEHRMRNQPVVRGGNCRNPAGDRHCYGHDIIGQQRCCGDETRTGSQVLSGDGVRASAVRIGEDRLPVRKTNQHQQPDDCPRDRNCVLNSSRGPEHSQHHQDLIGRISHGRDSIRREDCERSFLV